MSPAHAFVPLYRSPFLRAEVRELQKYFCESLSGNNLPLIQAEDCKAG